MNSDPSKNKPKGSPTTPRRHLYTCAYHHRHGTSIYNFTLHRQVDETLFDPARVCAAFGEDWEGDDPGSEEYMDISHELLSGVPNLDDTDLFHSTTK